MAILMAQLGRNEVRCGADGRVASSTIGQFSLC
jgi:hypothetical protein